MAGHCVLGRDHCRPDSCIACGWNKEVQRDRIRAIHAGGLRKDPKTGLYRLKIRKEHPDERTCNPKTDQGMGRTEQE